MIDAVILDIEVLNEDNQNYFSEALLRSNGENSNIRVKLPVEIQDELPENNVKNCKYVIKNFGYLTYYAGIIKTAHELIGMFDYKNNLKFGSVIRLIWLKFPALQFIKCLKTDHTFTAKDFNSVNHFRKENDTILAYFEDLYDVIFILRKFLSLNYDIFIVNSLKLLFHRYHLLNNYTKRKKSPNLDYFATNIFSKWFLNDDITNMFAIINNYFARFMEIIFGIGGKISVLSIYYVHFFKLKAI